eukprot:scaffold8157_cov136-Skeletonema_menzelii.AAC.7
MSRTDAEALQMLSISIYGIFEHKDPFVVASCALLRHDCVQFFVSLKSHQSCLLSKLGVLIGEIAKAYNRPESVKYGIVLIPTKSRDSFDCPKTPHGGKERPFVLGAYVRYLLFTPAATRTHKAVHVINVRIEIT